MTLSAWVEPQLATLVTDPPPGDGWVHEIKLDGYRILLRIERGRVKLLTRNRQDWTARYPVVAEAAATLPVKEALLDGEIVALDAAGVSRFQALQAFDAAGTVGTLVYVAFDLLFLEGRDLRARPLLERKARLARLLEGRRGRLRYSEHFDQPGRRVHERACRLGLEGIVSKLKTAPYTSGRGQSWLKVKCVARQELVIGGYTDPEGARVELGSLLVGVHEADGRLVYAGRVGTGFDQATLRRLGARLRKLARSTSPFASDGPRPVARGAHWVSRSWWPRWRSPNGPATGSCAIPPSWGSARTSRPARSCASPAERRSPGARVASRAGATARSRWPG
jgi:bifunctional non-homologous end joining protein LigD